jgi:hypothetical protein
MSDLEAKLFYVEMQRALSNLRNYFKEECDKCHNFFPRLKGYQIVTCPFCGDYFMLFGSYMGDPWSKEDEESYRKKLKETKKEKTESKFESC